MNSLDKTKLQSLLGAIGSRPAAPAEQPDAVEYDWRRPHYFSTRQLAMLKSFVNNVAAQASSKLTSLCQSDLGVKVSSTTEYFARDIIDTIRKQEPKGYYLVFATAQERSCGFIDIPSQGALGWAAQLLGDSDLGENAERELSELEQSLLSDAAMALVRAFSDSFEDRDFQPVTRITRELPTLPFQDTDEVCMITIEATRADAESGSPGNLVILSRELIPVVGPEREISTAVTAEDTSRAILSHLLRMPIVARAILATATITLQQAMTLESGDILLLNKKLNEPMELTVDGRKILHGWPAKSTNRYALVVTETDARKEA